MAVGGERAGGVRLGHQETVDSMAKAVKDIEREIRALSSEERAELMRSLIADLDAPADADADVERAWLETSQRRYRELVEGKVRGIPGPLVFDRLRKRLGE
jgi:acyl-CoA reductase-like NAD-dependent aldehyde dehydrogenase